MPELVGGVDFTTLDFLGLILGATGSIDDMSACLGLIGALADDFFALPRVSCLGLIGALADDFFALPRGSLGRGGGRNFPRDAAAMAAAVLFSGESGAGFSGRWVFGDWLVTAAAMAFPV